MSTPVVKSNPHFGKVEGPSLETLALVSGLGQRYFDCMNQNKDKLHQIDALSGVTETKGSVRSRAIKVAADLQSRGVQPNHIVVISSITHLDQTVALLAVIFAGAIVAPLHVDMAYDDTKRLMGILQPKVAFCGQRSARLFQRVFKEKGIKCVIIRFYGDGKDFVDFGKCLEGKENVNYVPVQIKDPVRKAAFIIASHGTEHEPKLIAISHQALLVRYYNLLKIISGTEKVLTFFPLSMITQVLVSCACFETQTKIVHAGQFTERSACKFIHDLRIEVCCLDGNFASKIVKNAPLQDFDLTCLKVIWIGGMHLSQSSFARIAKTFKGVHIYSGYSTIETGIISILTEDVYYIYKDKLGSLGKPYTGVSVRVVDEITRVALGFEKWGELLVKSPSCMLGYYGDQAATNRAFTRGFFKTGDIAQLDPDGYIYLRGRSSDDIKKDGHIFSSSEIEDIIRLHRGVDEVAVFATANEIVACIVKTPGYDVNATIIKDYLTDVLPSYKVPTKIDFYEFFPKTLHGQIKKYILKENIIKLIREESFYHSEHVENE